MCKIVNEFGMREIDVNDIGYGALIHSQAVKDQIDPEMCPEIDTSLIIST